jgi:hypothetical protein
MTRSHISEVFCVVAVGLLISGCTAERIEQMAFNALQNYHRRTNLENQPYQPLDYHQYKRMRSLGSGEKVSDSEQTSSYDPFAYMHYEEDFSNYIRSR